ncbi:MAG: glutamine-hydrolyzing GMP synthase, partial [Clostridia bacterium]|nr:glutamine-hydrolyzing GMP synthase [Clostridia bacterium]
TVWQYFTVVPDFKAVGVRNHERSMGYMCVIRAVNTIDAMTATIERIDYDLLEKIADRITAEVTSINRVVYEVTKKPVATIEFE